MDKEYLCTKSKDGNHCGCWYSREDCCYCDLDEDTCKKEGKKKND